MIKFKPLNLLDSNEIEIIAKSICQLDSLFYMSILDKSQNYTSIICMLIEAYGTDLCAGDAAFYKDKLVGYSCYFPARERLFRSVNAMKILTEKLTPIEREKIISIAKGFSKRVAPIESTGLYLNKIHSFNRGAGVGTALLKKFIEQAKLKDISCCLHVNKENLNALRFYQNNGFKVDSCDSEYDYVLMIRE